LLHDDEGPGIAGNREAKFDYIANLDTEPAKRRSGGHCFFPTSPPLHGDYLTLFLDEREGDANKGGNIREGPGDNPVEKTGIPRRQFLGAGMERLEVVQPEKPGRMTLEYDLLLDRID
jgi:hypothetical protein